MGEIFIQRKNEVTTSVCLLLIEKDGKIMIEHQNQSKKMREKIIKPLSIKCPNSKDIMITLMESLAKEKYHLSGIDTNKIQHLGDFSHEEINFYVFWIQINPDIKNKRAKTRNLQVEGQLSFIRIEEILNPSGYLQIRGHEGDYLVPESLKKAIELRNVFRQQN